MHSVQRQFGKFMKRTPDNSKVSVLLKDFEDADKLLTRVQSDNNPSFFVTEDLSPQGC